MRLLNALLDIKFLPVFLMFSLDPIRFSSVSSSVVVFIVIIIIVIIFLVSLVGRFCLIYVNIIVDIYIYIYC